MERHRRLPSWLRLVAMLVAWVVAVGGCGSSGPSASVGVAESSASVAPVASVPACRETPAMAIERPWWSDRIFYEVFVRSFADSDGDGIGDLAGLTDRLDHLNDGDPTTTDDLGVTGIWLMPVAESPSYHGYDVTDYRSVEADYGTADDFRAFIAAAHERGIEVIVDLVVNHSSREHPWFQDALTPGSAHDDWYVWADEHPGIARSDGARVWHEANGRFYYGYFWEGMPDLNLENEEVTAEIDSIASFWLDEMEVDGFRLDAARHLVEENETLENAEPTFEWLARFRDRLHADHPEALVLGEVFDSSVVSSRYIREGSLDLTFDFSLASAVITSLNSRDAGAVAAAHRELAERYPLDTVATFLTNHDQNRVASQLGGDLEAQKLAATLLLTGPGVPFMYYGEEIGMAGRKPDERIRTPMRWDATEPAAGFSTAEPWQPLGDDPPGADVATQSADPDSLLATYRALAHLRAAHPALLSGDIVPVDAADRHVVSFLRSTTNDVVLVAANLGIEPVDAPALTLDQGPLCGEPSVVSLWGPEIGPGPAVNAGGGFEAYTPVERLGPREAVVIDLAGG